MSRLTEVERRRVVVEWNVTQAPYPQQACIHELFEAQVKRAPNAVAVISADASWTYGELNQRANQLARYLRRQGLKREGLVGICVERSPHMVVGLLGILKAGGAYVPLDPAYPPARLEWMLRDAQVEFLLTQESLLTQLPDSAAHLICLDHDAADYTAERTDDPIHYAEPDDLAYVIYTSGSTGTPKGVLGLHRGAVNRFHWMWRTFPFEADDVCCQKTALSFVDSVWEVFGPLLQGVPSVIMTNDVLQDPYRLTDCLAAYAVTRLVLVPSLLRAVLDADTNIQHQLPHLKLWVSSGEALSSDLAQRFQERVPQGRLLNFYGSSEVAADATWFDVSAGLAHADISIGRPIANMQVYILDADLEPVPIGEPGELHIAGVGLARGYLNRPDLTQERFLPNPFSPDPNDRLFKTGDLGRYRPDGTIEFLGRLDHQVKIRGIRVELGEIEATLERHPTVQQSAVVLREDTPGEPRLAAYLVPDSVHVPTRANLRGWLKSQLPNVMTPSAFVLLDALPLMPNGKLNRHALPAPEAEMQAPNDAYEAPRDAIEQQLIAMWEHLLGVQPIDLQGHFFDLGGDSLMAARLFELIRRAFGRRLPLATLLQAPTVAELAQLIRQESETASWSSLVALQPEGPNPPLFLVHPGGGNVLTYRDLALRLGSQQPVYALQAQGLDGQMASLTRVEDMATHYLSVVQGAQPHGPYFIGGLSTGGEIAWEMACQLHAIGEDCKLLALFDTYGPGYPQLLPPVQRIYDVFQWMLRDTITRIIRFPAKLVVTINQRGWHGTCRVVLETLRLAQPIRNPHQPEPKYESLQSKIARYQRHAHTTRVWERRLNVAIVRLLNRSSVPDVARRFANTINEVLGHLNVQEEVPEDLRQLERVINQASDAYQPRAYSGRVTYFEAERPPGVCQDPFSGWQNIALGGMDVYRAPGAHADIVYSPELAEQLKLCLDRLQTPADDLMSRST